MVLEAQAAGLPAIVSDSGGPQEIVVPDQTGLVVAVERPGALAAAMARFFDDGTRLAEMAAARGGFAAERQTTIAAWPDRQS